MDNNIEKRIRERAYRIWLEEGRPDGRAKAHWDMARELVAIETNQMDATEPNPATEARDRASHDRPVEPIEAVENQGEFPTLTDQGDKRSYPKKRRRRARRDKL